MNPSSVWAQKRIVPCFTSHVATPRCDASAKGTRTLLPAFGLFPGKACKPFHATGVLVTERHDPLEALRSLTSVPSFYLVSSEGLTASSGCPRESAALSWVLAGRDGGAYERNVGVGRWQEMTWGGKPLFDSLRS